MIKTFFFLLISICISIEVNSQVIRGTVTNPEGEPIRGVKVFAGEGHLSFSHTDKGGIYEIRVAEKATQLKFSGKGLKTITLPITGKTVDAVMEKLTAKEAENKAKNSIRVKLWSDSVKTIPGSDSKIADIGYEIDESIVSSSSLKQVIEGTGLNPAHQNNINNILAGKIAGLKFYGQSDMALGRTGSVSFRGQSGFSGGQGPIYIVDGTVISDINDLNYNEIEKVSVFPGPASSALLGSKGSNGAVIITTKKTAGTGNKTSIEFNTGIKLSKVSILPVYQNTYAGGNVYNMYQYTYRPGIDPVEWAPLDGKYYHDYTDDCSWGPEMEGQEYIPWYSWYSGTKYTGTTAKLVPQPDNVKDFYNTGITISNSIAFSKSSDGFSVRASYENIDLKGLIPGTSLEKNSFGLRASFNVTNRIRIESNINFFTRFQEGEIDDNYSNVTTGSFNSWFHRDLDMSTLKDLRGLLSPYVSHASWNHGNPIWYDPYSPLSFFGSYYWLNSYTWFDITDFSQRNDRLHGDIALTWSAFKGVDLKLTYRRQESTGWYEVKVPNTNVSGAQSTQIYRYGYYSTGSIYSCSDNFEGLATIKKEFSGISINADLGFDFFSSIYKSNSANTVQGFSIPGLYTISNSRDLPQINNLRSEEKLRSLFLNSTFGYKDFLFADIVLRKEYHSPLPGINNSLFAKSFGGSFVFSRLFSFPFMDFGKLRISYGEIPTGLSPYVYPGVKYGIGQNLWNGSQVMSTPDNSVPADLKGSVKSEFESGIDLEFFNDRIGLSMTWWKGKETGIPVTVAISEYSGFKTRMINSGTIEKSGMDIILNLLPVATNRLTWQSDFVLSRTKKMDVTKIAGGITMLTMQSFLWSSMPSMVAATGKRWGEMYGSGMKTDANGKPLLNTDGTYVADPKKYFGSAVPDFTGGWQNSVIMFNCLTVNINFDYQVGGKFFSLSDMWGTFSGLTARTAVLNDKGNPIRDQVTDGGGVHVFGVDATSGKDVDYYIDAQDYFHNLYDNRIFDGNVYDASYLKLRELSIGYTLPVEKVRIDKIISGATISLFAQNPWMIFASQRNFDPSELSKPGGEFAQYPGVKSFGMNIKVVF